MNQFQSQKKNGIPLTQALLMFICNCFPPTWVHNVCFVNNVTWFVVRLGTWNATPWFLIQWDKLGGSLFWVTGHFRMLSRVILAPNLVVPCFGSQTASECCLGSFWHAHFILATCILSIRLWASANNETHIYREGESERGLKHCWMIVCVKIWYRKRGTITGTQ